MKHSYVAALGEDFWKLAPGLPGFAACIFFLFAVWAFAVVNHHHEYNYELSPMSHDSHSSSSDAVIFPCCSNQSKSAPHPSSTKADRCCCHFLGSLLSLNFWKSPAGSSQSVAAAISLLMLFLRPRLSAVVPSQCPSCCPQAGMWAFPSTLSTPVPKSRQLQDNGGLEVPLQPVPFRTSTPSLSLSDN